MMIKYFNRKSQNYEIENVAGGKYLTWTYSSACGMSLLEAIVKKKLFSKIYGNFCDSKLSKIKINKFIEQFNIDMNESLNDKTEFRCFNDFFTRKLKLSARPLSMAPSDLVSPCDSRLMCYTDINYKSIIQVKGFTYSLEDLIKDHETALSYDGGTVMVFRLCPTDYHRFHFIDSGSCSKSKKINGFYYSVNPIALKSINNLFCQNKREWSTFHSENFKDVLYIEVGATCVGSIIQTYKPEASIKKGSEKGYFKFGGSTVILVFKKDTIKIDDDILEKSLSGIETLIKMGETIGKKA